MRKELLTGLHELELRGGRLRLGERCRRDAALSWSLCGEEDALCVFVPAREEADARARGHAALDKNGFFRLPDAFCRQLEDGEWVCVQGMRDGVQITRGKKEEEDWLGFMGSLT